MKREGTRGPNAGDPEAADDLVFVAPTDVEIVNGETAEVAFE